MALRITSTADFSVSFAKHLQYRAILTDTAKPFNVTSCTTLNIKETILFSNLVAQQCYRALQRSVRLKELVLAVVLLSPCFVFLMKTLGTCTYALCYKFTTSQHVSCCSTKHFEHTNILWSWQNLSFICSGWSPQYFRCLEGLSIREFGIICPCLIMWPFIFLEDPWLPWWQPTHWNW